MPSDCYRTLASPAEFRHNIDRSDFLGLAARATTDEEFFTFLHGIEKKYFDATHHCWAFRLFAEGAVRVRSSDAGEPSGTAGKPILAAIEGADLHDTGVVVVRWFGGVKLGTGGLSRAYRETAAATLRDARYEDRYLYDRFEVIAPFAMLGAIYRLPDPPQIVLAGESFADLNRFSFDVRRSRSAEFERRLTERRLSFSRPTPPER